MNEGERAEQDGDRLAGIPLSDLVDRLAADAPAPGAGPAAAWACAMAAALVEMVTAVELRRDPGDGGPAAGRAERAAALRERALELADLDVAAYTRVLEVLARRAEPGHGGRLREALAEAAGPPLDIARAAAEATRLAADAAAVARGGVRGEAVAAAVLGEAAVRASVPLVEINLAGHRGDARLDEIGDLARAAATDLARAQAAPRARRAGALSTRLTERLGLVHPIVLAPMAFAAGGRLAGAVSQAGGLGLIGGGYCDPDWIDEQFDLAGDAAVGCGFITWALAQSPDVLDRVLRRRPRAIMLSFGDARPFAPAIREAGVPLICQVQTAADAALALEAGADVVVAQGAEAGGHGDRRATFTLVPEVADLIAERSPDTLLCAAGGIADGRGLAAALMLGADGVVVGSRLWATEEAQVSDAMRDAALAADGDATVRTSVVDVARSLDWPGRFTARVLRNGFTERWHGNEDELREAGDSAARAWREGWAAGDPERASTFIGEAVGLIAGIEPAAEVIERMSEQAAALVRHRDELRPSR